ncbi:hypothetical protein RIF29_27349 [Crotalaria pallida]|uniref:Leucine-rich repeat-containing N-terminal plant-type domain-containing protein n=1 Tax=Crotalaria pallida TaxID=3830 RepID=A0AAN9ER88_CROPI
MGWLVVLPYLFHLLLLFHFPTYTFSLCNPHDLSALLLFNNSFIVNNTLADQSPWYYYCPTNVSSKTTSWNKNSDCCEWDGVTCDTMSGHVIGLDLSCSMLQGQFHPNTTLFHLTHLQRLNLTLNHFHGDIPSSISHLSKLISLDLSNHNIRIIDPYFDGHGMIMRLDPSTWKRLIFNASDIREIILDGIDMSSINESSLSLLLNLSSSLVSLSLRNTGLHGNLPSGILYLPNLQELSLAINENLRGELPKSNWTTPLRHLILSHTSFSGEIPNSIGHLKSLNHLQLSYCKFHGLIPSSLWYPTQLTILGLSSNHLTGEILPTVSNLKHLTSLHLSHNNLQGQIPSSLFDLTQLTYLDLSSNNLTVDISLLLSNLKHLTFLNLSSNNLEGQLIGSISEFSTYSMEYLDLSKNKLQGNFSSIMYEFENLTVLDLSSNDMSGIVDFQQLSKLKKLEFLQLSQNNFHFINMDTSVDHILPNLELLSLSSCNINSFPKFISQLQNLQMLDLSYNKIHGNIPNWFYENLLLSWRNIYYIDLSFNQLQGDIPIPPYGIWFFSVSNNNLSGDISSSICNASSLEILNLSHNNLSGKIPQCLGNLPFLWVLDLQRNNLHGSIPTNFSMGNMFETMKLNGNRLEGPLPQSLAHCKYLEVLDVGDNNIEDMFPSWLETLQELHVLSLRSNKFHGTITCSSIKNPFPKLRIFDVSNNHFSGPLPTSCIKNFQGMMNVNDSHSGLNYMGNHGLYNDSIVIIMKGQFVEFERILAIFTTIDFSNNIFEGEVPKVIGELKSLKGLNLSHNGINGTIPQSLGNLTSLEWLDLSWNRLTGEIPRALLNLNFLSVLNLSENQLAGMIPVGGQFNTFENVSYEGNPMLCGFPLSRSCNEDEEQLPKLTFHHEEESEFFGWKAVAVGYASGVVFGMVLGYSVFFNGKPQWLARFFGAILN